MSSRVIYIIFLIIPHLFAQTDSIKNYNLNEITVQSSILIKPKPLLKLPRKKITGANSFSLNNVFYSFPSIKVQNNSRGESLIYFRGSGKRQLTLFFDGVPINIPWDNRIDLSLIPTNALESIEITKGIPSVVYGANTIAGVVNISSLKLNHNSGGNFKVQLGENNYQNFAGFWNDRIGKLKYIVSLNYFNTSGFYLPAQLNNNKKRKLRINSNRNSLNGLLKLNYDYGISSNTSLLFSFNNSTKGVPPEKDVNKPRYWKYPVWLRLSTILNGTHKFSNGSNVSYSFSATKFNSQIDQYKTEKYSEIDDVEKGEDISFYGKILFTKIFTPTSIIKLVAGGLSSKHIEQIKSDNFEEVTYAQSTFSGGVEYEYLRNKFSSIIGISLDGQATPLTGKQSSKDMILDVGANLTFSYPVFNKIQSQISFGKKSRFPTLREQFSGALGRFIVNPKLKAETAYSSELSFSSEIAFTKNQLNLFLTYINDGIVRVSLPNKKLMRINKKRIRNYGFDFTSNLQLNKNLLVSVGLSYLNAFAENGNGEFVDTLEYKPQFIFNGELNYKFLTNTEGQLQINYFGKEFGIRKGTEAFQELDDYLIMNFKLSYLLNFKNIQNFKVYFRVNNIFDKLYYTQWGLPEAGRQFFIGTNLSF